MLLADRLGYVQLAEPVRFTAAWERGASLRLRAGDATALDDYDQHGRIRGAPPDQAMDQAARAYVAGYLDGRDVLLMAADWARCRELSARIRDDLIHLGLVDGGRTVRIAEGAEASVGDLIICRRQRPRHRGGRAGPGPGQRRRPAGRGHHQPRPHGPPSARPGPGDRAAAVHRPGVLLPRLPVLRPGLRGHRALRPGRHRAHRHRPGHRDRGPAVAVPGDDPRHRRQPRVRVHHAEGGRPAARHPARPRTRPLRPHPPRARGIPARPARQLDGERSRPAGADRRARRRPGPRRRRAVRHRDPAAEPGQRRPPGHP